MSQSTALHEEEDRGLPSAPDSCLDHLSLRDTVHDSKKHGFTRQQVTKLSTEPYITKPRARVCNLDGLPDSRNPEMPQTCLQGALSMQWGSIVTMLCRHYSQALLPAMSPILSPGCSIVDQALLLRYIVRHSL